MTPLPAWPSPDVTRYPSHRSLEQHGITERNALHTWLLVATKVEREQVPHAKVEVFEVITYLPLAPLVVALPRLLVNPVVVADEVRH